MKTRDFSIKRNAVGEEKDEFSYIMTLLNTDGSTHKILFDDRETALQETAKLLRSLRVAAVTLTKTV